MLPDFQRFASGSFSQMPHHLIFSRMTPSNCGCATSGISSLHLCSFRLLSVAFSSVGVIGFCSTSYRVLVSFPLRRYFLQVIPFMAGTSVQASPDTSGFVIKTEEVILPALVSLNTLPNVLNSSRCLRLG